MTTLDHVTLEHLDVATATERIDELVAVYLEVYAGTDDPFFGEDRYRQQLAGHMAAPAWHLVLARAGGETVGYIYGFALSPRTRWWEGFTEPPPAGFTDETGNRTYAISEIMVREPWRRRGVGRALHDALVQGRAEKRATALVEPGNVPSQTLFASAGWSKIGQLRPAWDGAPLYDVIITPLPPSA